MLQLRYCSVEWTKEGSRVVFPDGTDTCAYPHPEQPHYHVIAHRCGYTDDLMAYCREHDLAHAVVAEEWRNEPSYVLLASAAGHAPEDRGRVLYEECAAQLLQRWARTNERPIIEGWSWTALRSVFLGYVAQLDRELR